MQKVLQFFTKNSFVFAFFLLQAIALILLVKNNNYQNSKILNSSNYLVGNLYSSIDNFNNYFHLQQDNVELAEQNALLLSSDIISFTRIFGNTVEINDTTYAQRYSYSTAKIINNSTNKRENYITINKGGINGVQSGMAVVSALGVVGIVKNVSENFSSVISILHKNIKVSGRLKKSGYYGSIIWEGNNYREAKLNDIPNHVKFNVGDTIVTSGYSSIFPENISIGTVKSFNLPEGSNFYNIDIEFSVDYKKVSHVYVVKNLQKKEQIQLEALNSEDDK